MRWKKRKKEQQPREGDRRIAEQFLLFPKYLDDEWRWLELTQIHQEYQPVYWVVDIATIWGWEDLHWATLDEPMA